MTTFFYSERIGPHNPRKLHNFCRPVLAVHTIHRTTPAPDPHQSTLRRMCNFCTAVSQPQYLVKLQLRDQLRCRTVSGNLEHALESHRSFRRILVYLALRSNHLPLVHLVCQDKFNNHSRQTAEHDDLYHTAFIFEHSDRRG